MPDPRISRGRRAWLGIAVGAAVGLTACRGQGEAPVLDPVDDRVVAVGEPLVIDLRASDPDGDRLYFAFDAPVQGPVERAALTMRPDGTGIFRWTPLADDVGVWFLDFSVSDGRQRDTVTAAIDVRPALGAAPVFRQPLGSGTTLDPERDACLEIGVIVEDQDDAEVGLAQAEPLVEGAELVQETGLSGTWTWCPSKAQLENERHPLVLTADDGTHPIVRKSYLVVLRSQPPDCPGEAPVITHRPADASTVLDLSIRAEISDDVGLDHEPTLYFTTVEPELPIDLSQLAPVRMELEAGDLRAGTWSADVPNPVAAQPEGSQAEVFYLIVAGEGDDAAGDCDHVSESPERGVHRMTVSNPGDEDPSPACEDDVLEDDDDRARASHADIYPDPFVTDDGMLCSGDDDWYQVELYTGETIVVDLSFVQSSVDEDLDLHFHDADGVDLTPCSEGDPGTCTAAQGQSPSSDERYTHTVEQPGCFPCSFYVRVHGWAAAQNEYDLQLALQ